MGIANWAIRVADIWEDKTYKYSYAINAEAELALSLGRCSMKPAKTL